MARKKNKKQNNDRPTINEAHSSNTAASDNQSNTMSKDDNNTTTPSDESKIKSNRGCLGIRKFKKPLWFQWNKYPKDGQPPTQSILEIAIYSFFIIILFALFYFFNRIPEYDINVELETLNNFRYVTHDIKKDSIYYLNYQAAELLFCIPMNSMGGMTTEDMINGNDKSNFSYQIKEDSMQINYSQINAIDGKITDLNYRWNKVFSSAIDHTWPLKRIWPSFSMGRGFGDQYPRCRFKYNESEDSSIIKKLELLKSIPQYNYDNDRNRNTYYIKTSLRYLYNFAGFFADTTWNSKFFLSFKDVDSRKATNNFIRRMYSRKINDHYYHVSEFFNQENLSFSPSRWATMYKHYDEGRISWSIQPSFLRIHPVASPSWFDLCDFSQARFHIGINTMTIDSLKLKFDFRSATDFYPIDIEPDEIGSNYMVFSNPDKIQQIKEDGLTFYANFKELINKQLVRTFVITALLSGLLIIMLTFIILGAYRSYKTIRNYNNKNTEL